MAPKNSPTYEYKETNKNTTEAEKKSIQKETKESLNGLNKDFFVGVISTISEEIDQDIHSKNFNKISEKFGLGKLKNIYFNYEKSNKLVILLTDDLVGINIKKLQEKEKLENPDNENSLLTNDEKILLDKHQLLAFLEPIIIYQKQAEKLGIDISLENNKNLYIQKKEQYRKDKIEYEKQYQQYLKERNKKSKTSVDIYEDDTEINNNSSNEYYGDSYTYNSESGNIHIDLENSSVNIEVKDYEKKILENEESRENFVNFYKTLNELGIASIWEYKEQIFNAMGGIGSNLSVDNNYLGNKEQKLFLNNILKSVGEKPIEENDLSEFKNLFKLKNNFQVVGNGYKNNTIKKGDSKIEEIFFTKYIKDFPKFQLSLFKENIEKDSN